MHRVPGWFGGDRWRQEVRSVCARTVFAQLDGGVRAVCCGTVQWDTSGGVQQLHRRLCDGHSERHRRRAVRGVCARSFLAAVDSWL